MANDYVTLLGVFKDHSAIVNTLWGILQVVTLGLLGFIYKDDVVRGNWRILGVLTSAFVGFAYGNQKAILRSQAVLRAVHDQFHDANFLAQVPEAVRPVLSAHQAAPVVEIERGHWLLIIAVSAAVWLPYFFARTKSSVKPAA